MGLYGKTTLTEFVDNDGNKYSKIIIDEQILIPEELSEEEIINYYRKIEKIIFRKNDKSRYKIN